MIEKKKKKSLEDTLRQQAYKGRKDDQDRGDDFSEEDDKNQTKGLSTKGKEKIDDTGEEKSKADLDADNFLRRASKQQKEKQKNKEPESNLNEKDGVFTPKFGDYKRTFGQEKPKEGHQWFHFRDSKNKYLGSVSAASKEEALKSADKFGNADHLLAHSDLIKNGKSTTLEDVKSSDAGKDTKVSEKAPVGSKTDEIDQDKKAVEPVAEKPAKKPAKKPAEEPAEEPADTEKTKDSEQSADSVNKEPEKPQLFLIDGVLHRKQGNSWVPHEEQLDPLPEKIPEAEPVPLEPKPQKKQESVEEILARNKPVTEDEDEHAFNSLLDQHTRLIHRVATGLKTQKKLPFSMEDHEIHEAGRKALMHTLHKYDEGTAKEYFKHSQEAKQGKEYDPDLGFHIFLKSQVEHHLLDAAHKKADLPSAAKKYMTAAKVANEGEKIHSTLTPTHEEDIPQNPKVPVPTPKTSNPGGTYVADTGTTVPIKVPEVKRVETSTEPKESTESTEATGTTESVAPKSARPARPKF